MCGRPLSVLFVGMIVALGADDSITCPTLRTMTVDVIELLAGRETAGKPELTVAHDGIEYLFATAENKSAFEKTPARFEIADGGACGRMGPLSGIGDTRRHVVHEGRVYLFASDACRDSFLKDPAKFIETDDPIPVGTPEEHARGRAILDRVVEWAGGRERIAAISTYRETVSRTEVSGGKEYAVSKIFAAHFPDRFLSREAWNESWFATIRGPEGAAMAATDRHNVVGPSRCRAFDRRLARSLLVILRSYASASHGASASKVVAVAEGEGLVGEAAVSFVKVSLNGATSRLAVEKSTGRPIQFAFRGRDGTSAIGNSIRTFTTSATVNGVRLPTAYTATFDGKDLSSAGLALDAFEINPELPKEMFVVRK